MPVYEYGPTGEGESGACCFFESLEKMGAEPIKSCPNCGAPIKRIPSCFYARKTGNLGEVQDATPRALRAAGLGRYATAWEEAKQQLAQKPKNEKQAQRTVERGVESRIQSSLQPAAKALALSQERVSPCRSATCSHREKSEHRD